MKNELVLNYKCDKCSEELRISPPDIVCEDWQESISKRLYTLTFIECDTCKNRMIVQVDDKHTLHLVKEIQKQIFNRLNQGRGALKTTSIVNSIESSMEELKIMRESLDEKLMNKTLVHPYRTFMSYFGLSPQISGLNNKEN